jgi:four helix bundle protein
VTGVECRIGCQEESLLPQVLISYETSQPHKGDLQLKSFRELRVWQAAMNLVEKIYRVTQRFPKQETYGLVSQIQRAAVSIPSNIAEGHTREHIKEYLHHLSMAQASLAEVETQLEISGRLKYLLPDELKELFSEVNSLGRQMYALRNSLTTN